MDYDATLHDWKIEDNYGVYRLVGTIYGDKAQRFADADRIFTSSLKSIDFENMVAVTRNTTYRLADV